MVIFYVGRRVRGHLDFQVRVANIELPTSWKISKIRLKNCCIRTVLYLVCNILCAAEYCLDTWKQVNSHFLYEKEGEGHLDFQVTVENTELPTSRKILQIHLKACCIRTVSSVQYLCTAEHCLDTSQQVNSHFLYGTEGEGLWFSRWKWKTPLPSSWKISQIPA